MQCAKYQFHNCPDIGFENEIDFYNWAIPRGHNFPIIVSYRQQFGFYLLRF